LLNGCFQILGIQVQAGRGHNHLALAAQEAQLAGGLGLGQVAGGQPLIFLRMHCAARPRCCRNRRAADQHFAVRAQLYLAPRQRLADGSLGHMKGVVQRNQRRGFRHSVALHKHEAQRVPELFQRAGQGSAAGDEHPELQSEGLVNTAEANPAPPRPNPRGSSSPIGQARINAFKMRLEQRQHPGHGGQDGDPFPADGLNHPGCHRPVIEMQLGGKDGWHPEPHGLAKDVAEGQGVQNAQRMDELLVAHVRLRTVLDRSHAGQHVAVGQHHALGIGGCAAGEENLQRSLGREPGNRPGFLGGQHVEPVLKGKLRPSIAQLSQQQLIAHGQPGRRVSRNPPGKIRASAGVQRNGQHPAQQASVESGNPFGAVFRPQQHAVARPNTPLGQQRGKAAGQSCQLAIGGYPPPVALVADNGNLAIV